MWVFLLDNTKRKHFWNFKIINWSIWLTGLMTLVFWTYSKMYHPLSDRDSQSWVQCSRHSCTKLVLRGTAVLWELMFLRSQADSSFGLEEFPSLVQRNLENSYASIGTFIIFSSKIYSARSIFSTEMKRMSDFGTSFCLGLNCKWENCR